MAEDNKDRRGEWWGGFFETINEAKYAADKAKFDECCKAQTEHADKEFKIWLEAEEKKREEAKQEPVSPEA